jgi:GTPase Era involved in 16S rRNA processing
LNNDFGVVSIVGTESSGKSFLLNKLLLQNKNGFAVGKNENSENNGIWIWSKPLLGYDNEGKTMQILLLDTQGFCTDSNDFNDDSGIHTLAILLSRYTEDFFKKNYFLYFVCFLIVKY